MSKNKILIIGSLPHKNKPNTYGGTTVLMQDFIDYLDDDKINYKFIQSNKYVFKGASFINFIYVLFKSFFLIPFSNVIMLNSSINGTLYLAPVIFVYSKIFKKKIVFRKFGGAFDITYSDYPSVLKFIANVTFLKSDIIYFETKNLISFFSKLKKNVKWFPNVRKRNDNVVIDGVFTKRFVFISHVKLSKGVGEIVECSKKLPDDYIIDVYGPISDENINHEFFKNSKVNYCGSLKPNDVKFTLTKYDVVLLPTYYSGEGYPGILIEAYSLGIPVITTLWKSIPEIVDHNKTGILIEPKSISELEEAILTFDSSNYLNFRRNAINKFSDFDREIVNAKVMEDLEQV